MRDESEGVVFVAGLMPESVCLMQEGATQSRDCLSQTRRCAATQPSREHVNARQPITRAEMTAQYVSDFK
jgi:hypothetical protein